MLDRAKHSPILARDFKSAPLASFDRLATQMVLTEGNGWRRKTLRHINNATTKVAEGQKAWY